MKKFFSVLTALVILSSFPNTSYAAKEDNLELYNFAYSLGADKNYLAVTNYLHDDDHPVNPDSYYDYLCKCSLLEAKYYPNRVFNSIVSTGSCVGISILEVLSHNGLIKPSDIQEGAATLSEIGYNETSDRYITDYHMIQGYTEFDSYEKYISFNTTYSEKIDNILDTAKKCMADNRYFLIIIRKNTFAHAVCGIGITDGSWTFNDKSYDKCILTLDSNAYTESSGCFTDENCIYINSKTKESYLPAYINKDGAGKNLDYIAIDNDELLNYKGAINPSGSPNVDVSEIKHCIFTKKNGINVYPVLRDGTQTPLPAEGAIDRVGYHSFFKADSVHAEIRKPKLLSADLRYINSDRWIDIEFLNYEMKEDESEPYQYDCDIDFSDDKVFIKNNNPEKLLAGFQLRMNRGTFNFEPNYWWFTTVNVDDDLTVEVRDEGMLFKSSGGIDVTVAPYYYTLDEEGKFLSVNMSVDPDNKAQYLCSNNDVLVKIDNDRNILYYIDDNEDDVYDTLVKTGDINCDSFIDAVDASKVLAIYAELSTEDIKPIKYLLGDMNGDGFVDAVDASAILVEYSRLSTN